MHQMALPKPPPWAPPPELVSRHPALRHLLSCNSMPHLRQIHALAITTGAACDNLAAARILSFSALSPTGSLTYARRFFAATAKADAFMFNILLRAYASLSNPAEAVVFFAEALESSRISRPGHRTLALVLKAASDTGALAVGKMLHGMAVKLALAADVSVQNFLVRMYSSFRLIEPARLVFDGISDFDEASKNIMIGGFLKCGLFDDARQMFDEMPQKGVISWSVMINGFVQSSQFRGALELFREMLRREIDPNESVYVNVFSACAHLGSVEQGRWVENYMRKKGFVVTVRIGTALIDMYLKCGCVEKAFDVFNSMERKNSLTWSAMIGGLAVNGHGEDSLMLFSLMEAAGIQPNEVTFVGVLNACSHSKLIDEGVRHFDSMTKVYGILPNVQHYCCLVDLYGRAGLLEKAEDVIRKMPMEPNIAVWGSLLNSCRIHGNIDLGEKVGRKLMELEPDNSGRYILLSNIFAAKGKWEEVGELRKIMKERGVVKIPGSSFIDVKGDVHEFIAGDSFHPQKAEIYAKLEEMSSKMKLDGYIPRTEQVLIDMEEEEKQTALHHHSEKLALAFGLIGCETGMVLRITKNLRVCDDCHLVMKLISKIYGREIVVRDRSRFHHFRDGSCSCSDYW
ncbi:Pentatricopeptide repeat-containing protein [Apostasia shenzhenica]|uniref:Pentatricopeptide repeat-containing protein n=1 Tax=Apostasia shenzhenica TaxID=1088818 RepID=A0A2H9ZTT2_9ASPA|nr:Pentatricopeptide repeat-containing protein [Apostasia shenzhenica]